MVRAPSLALHHRCSTDAYEDLRQCLLYDSAAPNARLIGIEYMVPKHVFETFDAAEQALWHSHEFEVKLGMLVMPKPDGKDAGQWEAMELTGMKEVAGLYRKTYHLWDVSRGDKFPRGTCCRAKVKLFIEQGRAGKTPVQERLC